MSLIEDNIVDIKTILKSLTEEDIIISDHAYDSLVLREGSSQELKKLLISGDSLVHSYQEKARKGETKHILYFAPSRKRTLKIPVVFIHKNKKKVLKVITYIDRPRNWQNMVRKR